MFSILSFHNRLAADDLYYLGCVPKYGIFDCMKDLYISYSGRWTAYSLTGLVAYLYYKSSVALFVFNVITISILFLLLYNILKTILEKISKSVLPRNLIFVFALILTSALFFTSFSKGETWFWLVQLCTYLWSIIALLVIIHSILKNNNKWFNPLLLFISSVFIGGASESYTLIFIFSLLSFLIIINSSEFFKMILPDKKKVSFNLIFSILIISASFLITAIAPGNEVRLNALPQPSFIERLVIPFESFVRLIILKISSIIPFLLIFCLPWLILGNYLSSGNKKNHFRFDVKPFVYLVVLLFVFILPTSIIMSEPGPDRALSIISFSLVFLFSGWFYYIGLKFDIKSDLLNLVKVFTAPAIIFIIILQIFNQYEITSAYSRAYDDRITFLQNANKNEIGFVEVDPLPESGMLYSAEISEDPLHFTNKFLASALSLNYKVKRAETP